MRGAIEAQPHSYRVVIGPGCSREFATVQHGIGIFISRINTMRPDSDANLERFLQGYQKFGCYFLMPAVWNGGTAAPEFIYGHDLLKRDIYVRRAWEIGINDPDGVAIQADDTPIIPAGQERAPVLEVLERKRAKKVRY